MEVHINWIISPDILEDDNDVLGKQRVGLFTVLMLLNFKTYYFLTSGKSRTMRQAYVQWGPSSIKQTKL